MNATPWTEPMEKQIAEARAHLATAGRRQSVSGVCDLPAARVVTGSGWAAALGNSCGRDVWCREEAADPVDC